MTLINLANPTRFLALIARILPWLAAATAILLALGLYQAGLAPDDYQQGATVKIMFIHVPNAWLSMFVWGVMSMASLGTLVWRHPLADVAAKSAAPIGAAFTFLALLTGSLWGRPMWGTYWDGYVRHPQYVGFILVMFGFLLQWPTLLTLAMFPVLVVMYVKLARNEEREALAAFGEDYRRYMADVPGFMPRLSRLLGGPAQKRYGSG